MREVAAATLAQTEAAQAQETAPPALPPLREAEARAGAALQRLVDRARDARPRGGARQERLAELEQRLMQFNDDIARERQLATDSEKALERLTDEAAALRRDLEAGESRRNDVGQRVTRPTRCCRRRKRTSAN